MCVTKELFGKTDNGKEVYCFTLQNHAGMRVRLLEYGAGIESILVPDQTGEMRDVTVGFDDMDGLQHRSDYQGAIAGPYANRIGGGSLCIDGKDYPLIKNEDNIQTLHSGGEYTHTVWNGQAASENAVCFSYTREDMLNGYPGAIQAQITYTLTEENDLRIHYSCTSDRKTYINPTNHTYFHLGGFGNGDILDHELMLFASAFTPVDKHSIPTGEIRSVKGTPFDFTTAKPIGKDIDVPCEQLQNTGGFDHNFCIDHWDGTMRTAAIVKCPATGITMTVSTDLPGIQFYAGNFLNGIPGKNGIPMNKRCGFCLETQYYPDTPHHASFPSCLFDAGEKAECETIFSFRA